MKRNRLIATLLLAVLMLSTLFGCTTTPSATPEATAATTEAVEPAATEAQAKPVQIHIYQSKYEIDEALKAACAEYTSLYPNVTFVVESTSSEDFSTQLKAMFSGGNAPDIFSTAGNVDLQLMSEYMEDLSDQTWVPYMSQPALDGGSYEGKVYGFPLAVEGHGYVYHKDMFTASGITAVPTTLTELRDACDKLVAAGYTPFSSNFMEFYQSAIFHFNSPLARQADPMAFIEALNNGTETVVGNQAFIDMANLVALEFAYAKSPLNTDFNTQVSDFANGQAAMMVGGTWSQPALDAVDPDMDVGMFPMPMSEDASLNDKLYVSSSPFWSINNASDVKDEAKKFLTWLAMTPEGQKNLTSGFKLIPAFTNISADESAIGPTGMTLKEYIDAGKTYGIFSAYYPQGFGGAQLFGESINKYAAGKLTIDELLAEIQAEWTSLQ
ncbi:MAG: extracellular solute-binding protein [Eubacteriales bacterium]|nr:extracellular solute-binding protein [Eubacteriales bacterium]